MGNLEHCVFVSVEGNEAARSHVHTRTAQRSPMHTPFEHRDKYFMTAFKGIGTCKGMNLMLPLTVQGLRKNPWKM